MIQEIAAAAALVHDYVIPTVAALGSVVIGASVYCSKTATPEPGSRRATIYRWIELSALIFGKAKEDGLLPATPRIDHDVGEIVAAVIPQQKP